MLLLGRVDRLNLDMRGVLLGDLIVDAVLVDGRDLVVDPLKLLRGHGVTMASATSLPRHPGCRRGRSQPVSLEPAARQARLLSSLARPGTSSPRGGDHPARAGVRRTRERSLSSDGPARLAFIPEDVSVESARVPQFLLEWFSQEWEIAVDLGQLPFSLVIEELRVGMDSY